MASQEETQERNDKDMTTYEPEIQYGGNKSMPFIIGNEMCEKLGSAGTSNNLLVYLTTVFHTKAITATTILNIFNGTCNFATLPGAILCDTYFGRYRTLGFGSLASFMGMLTLALTAAIPNLHPSHCDKEKNETCHGPTPWQMVVLLGAFGLMATGSGGIRPCNLAFGADQFDPNTESGKKGIKRFFNWYYFSLTLATILSFTVIAYVQSSKSWALGLAIPAFLMLLSCLLFFMGSRVYVKVKPNGSPLMNVVRVIVAAVKKRRMKSPEQPWLSLFNHMHNTSINSKLPYTDQFRFLDKAAIFDCEDTIKPDGSADNPWRLCSMQQVEEVKCLIRVLPIWTTANIYYIAMSQLSNFSVFQALQSDRRFGNTEFQIPPATFSIFTMVGVTIWIPIYDRIIGPTLKRFTGEEAGITLLQKMASGMVLSAVSMLISGLVEERRRSLALTKPIGIEPGRGEISPLSGFLLVPQMTLMGFSEALTIISHIELYYDQFPENMRSISGSFLYIGFGVSNYLSSLLVAIVHHTTKSRSAEGGWLAEDLNKGRLDFFYYLVAALQVMNLGYFMLCVRWYKYKGKVASNAIEVEN